MTYCSVDSFGISSSLCALDSLNVDGTGVVDSFGISSSLCALDDLNIDDIDVVDSFGISSSLCALDSLNIVGTGVDEVGFKPASLGLGLCTDLPVYIDRGKIHILTATNFCMEKSAKFTDNIC